MAREYVVSAFWDAEAGVWVTSSSDVPGLATEAASLDRLVERVAAVVPELLEDNAHLVRGDRDPDERISLHIVSSLAEPKAA